MTMPLVGAGVAARSQSSGIQPDDLSGLLAWYKADALSLANNDPVASWTDSSGNGKHATQSTAGLKPLFKTNVQNSKPGVLWDGIDDLLVIPSLTFGPFTIVAAIKMTAAGCLFSSNPYSGTNYESVDRMEAALVVKRAGGTDIFADVEYDDTWMDGNYIITIKFDGTFAGTTVRRNGVAKSLEDSGGLGDPGISVVSRAIDLGSEATDRACDGYFLELAIYNAAKSLSDQQSLESYLNNKWALY